MGLWAISAGLAFTITDDQELLAQGMIIYDTIYSWVNHLQVLKHTQNPTERLLLQVLPAYLKPTANRKSPAWVDELKEMIQD